MVSVIDLFCGIGGLSYGLKKSGIEIKAGIDLDSTCEYAYSQNVGADFINADINSISSNFLINKYWNKKDEIKILVGCAPCQPFSSHSNKVKGKESTEKWNLIKGFERLIAEISPEIVSMENVPNLSNQKVFLEFVDFLKNNNYNVFFKNVYCPDYGMPQKRRRLVLLASKLGEIKLIKETHSLESYITTKNVIGDLEPIEAGKISPKDPLHQTANLSEINLRRIKASRPNGTWLDWDEELRLECHKRETGNSYKAVYGRMSWDEPAPTITTQFYNYGTGRFGHPEQNRALTIREAALLQTFPMEYKFYKSGEGIFLTKLGTHIGNAVPVDLGLIIGKSIKKHLKKHLK
jgi:DNA (cytosine-5)-methyltransferase 1